MQFPQNLLNWENGSENEAGNEVVTGIFYGKQVSVSIRSAVDRRRANVMSVEIFRKMIEILETDANILMGKEGRCRKK